MKRKITTALIALMFTSMTQTMAQTSGQIIGQSNTAGNLYQENYSIGVGSTVNPKARIHIFNRTVYLSAETEPPLKQPTLRPFLISGLVYNLGGNALNPPPSDALFTVDKKGYVGIDVLNPSSKLTIFGSLNQAWNSGIKLSRQGGGDARMVVDAQGLKFRTMLEGSGFYFKNSSEFTNLVIKYNGFVGIGTETPAEKLDVKGNVLVDGNTEINGNEVVNGNITINNGFLLISGNNASTVGGNEILLGDNGLIRAREIKVDLQAIPDYVFNKDYKLMSLEDLKVFIETNKHLPNVKSEAEFTAEGSISLTEMNLKLLEKVEELTLYVLDLQAQIDKLKIR